MSAGLADRQGLDFDPNALREKYRLERDKRLRPEGNNQYIETKGDFRHYVDDPYVEKNITRAPMNGEVEIAIIGGGFGGLIAGARLRQAGFKDIRIIEKGGDFGGTWYWNRYPGAQCDIESYIYLPLLEETNYIPREKYSFGPEIREHARRIGEQFGLYHDALFQTEIRELRWLDDDKRWLITTNRNDHIRARFVVMSNGPLNRPKLPGIPGIDTFAGHTFHTSRWDYGYTGGDTTGNLNKISHKRIAIIGTGATAIQCVPHLARDAGQLYVFQRTPSSVDVRGNRPTDRAWAQSLQPGWHKARMDNFNALVSGVPQPEDLVSDGWTDIIRNLAAFMPHEADASIAPEEIAQVMELADFRKMNEIRARVDTLVSDKSAAERLKPWYRQFCKRPTFNDDYLPAFNRPNVTLIDTLGRGVDRITPRGIVFDEVEYPVDCIIFATGFEVGTSYTRRAGFEVYGRNNKSLAEYWAKGLRTLHGFYSHGFPNCFHLGITQGTITPNFPHMLDEQAQHVTALVREAMARQARALEPTAAAESDWVETIRNKALPNREFLESCTPSYYNNEGRPGEGNGIADEQFGGGSIAFFNLIQAWRAQGEFGGIMFDA